MAWVHLVIAGAIEIGWALGLKHTEGLSKHFWISVLTLIGMVLSYVFLALALRTLPVSVAYPVWTGMGAVGAAILGMWLLGEPRDAARVACVGLIIAGVVGLKYLSG
jgi:quaternary ammonium compound-resistance protein SugE